VLTDSEITLQAISWAPNPQKRIAVINNRILRQRDMVAGYRIDTINQDDVVLSDKGKKWKLVFRIK
jgi:type II secretory pathway component PulC